MARRSLSVAAWICLGALAGTAGAADPPVSPAETGDREVVSAVRQFTGVIVEALRENSAPSQSPAAEEPASQEPASQETASQETAGQQRFALIWRFPASLTLETDGQAESSETACAGPSCAAASCAAASCAAGECPRLKLAVAAEPALACEDAILQLRQSLGSSLDGTQLECDLDSFRQVLRRTAAGASGAVAAHACDLSAVVGHPPIHPPAPPMPVHPAGRRVAVHAMTVAPQAPVPASAGAVQEMRQVARALEEAAHRLENLQQYQQADALRQQAQQLRLTARGMDRPLAAVPSNVLPR